MLGFSRQVQSAKRDICFNNTIMETSALVRHAFALDRIEIILNLDDRLPIIYADPEKLKQVWINLFGNARDAMPGGGLILVKVSLDSPRQIITVQVADTGSGMAVHELNKIFDPFYSPKPVGQGTGLGLFPSGSSRTMAAASGPSARHCRNSIPRTLPTPGGRKISSPAKKRFSSWNCPWISTPQTTASPIAMIRKKRLTRYSLA